VLLIHSEIFCSLALAGAVMRLTSCALNDQIRTLPGARPAVDSWRVFSFQF
jgi:hypothetical protein